MTLPILELPPNQIAYRARQRSRALNARYQGSQSRYRKTYDGPAIVRVSWTLDEPEYDGIVRFYMRTLRNGALPFSLDLVVEDGSPETQTVRMVPDTFRLRSIRGETYNVSAELEVI